MRVNEKPQLEADTPSWGSPNGDTAMQDSAYQVDEMEVESFPAWTDMVRYVPSEMEEQEALDFFDAHPVEAFEAWVSDLDDRSFQSISDALRVLRSAIIRFHAEQDARINMIDILAEIE
jgi:hypothetical protein